MAADAKPAQERRRNYDKTLKDLGDAVTTNTVHISEMRSEVSGLKDEFKSVECSITEATKSMQEITTAWSNAKGFVSVLKWLASTAKVLLIVFAACGLLWLFLLGDISFKELLNGGK